MSLKLKKKRYDLGNYYKWLEIIYFSKIPKVTGGKESNNIFFIK